MKIKPWYIKPQSPSIGYLEEEYDNNDDDNHTYNNYYYNNHEEIIKLLAIKKTPLLGIANILRKLSSSSS